jgi:hypothetical protein
LISSRETRKKKVLWSIIDNWEAGWPEMKKLRLTPLPPIWEGGEGTTFFENPDWKDTR